MSIEFDWARLLEDDVTIETKICDFLHNQFQSIHLPPFIQSLSVTSFKLGSAPPEVTLRHFSDPFREFYGYDQELQDNQVSLDSSRSSTPMAPSSAPMLRPGLMSSISYPPFHLADRSLDSFVSESSASVNSMGSVDSQPQALPELYPAAGFSGAPDDLFDEPVRDTTQRTERPLDAQAMVEFKYAGDMQISLSATLLVNYPAPSFISLPLAIQVTGLDIHCLAVAAFIEPYIHFSILCDVSDDETPPSATDEVDVIKNMRIESEIGDNSNHGAVLRNVGKVEKFVLEQLRRVIREEVVWPGWITLEI